MLEFFIDLLFIILEPIAYVYDEYFATSKN